MNPSLNPQVGLERESNVSLPSAPKPALYATPEVHAWLSEQQAFEDKVAQAFLEKEISAARSIILQSAPEKRAEFEALIKEIRAEFEHDVTAPQARLRAALVVLGKHANTGSLGPEVYSEESISLISESFERSGRSRAVITASRDKLDKLFEDFRIAKECLRDIRDTVDDEVLRELGQLQEISDRVQQRLLDRVNLAREKKAIESQKSRERSIRAVSEPVTRPPRVDQSEQQKSTTKQEPSIHEVKTVLDKKVSFEAEFLSTGRELFELPLSKGVLSRTSQEIQRQTEQEIEARLEKRGQRPSRDLQGKISLLDQLKALEAETVQPS